MIKSYKMRAECLHDVMQFNKVMGHRLTTFTIQKSIVPDVVVTFESISDLSEIKELIKEIQDGHVMLETVETESNYTGERK